MDGELASWHSATSLTARLVQVALWGLRSAVALRVGVVCDSVRERAQALCRRREHLHCLVPLGPQRLSHPMQHRKPAARAPTHVFGPYRPRLVHLSSTPSNVECAWIGHRSACLVHGGALAQLPANSLATEPHGYKLSSTLCRQDRRCSLCIAQVSESDPSAKRQLAPRAPPREACSYTGLLGLHHCPLGRLGRGVLCRLSGAAGLGTLVGF